MIPAHELEEQLAKLKEEVQTVQDTKKFSEDSVNVLKFITFLLNENNAVKNYLETNWVLR